jgi:alkylation response protein AidB-like acyl-CoA dehydrogenase
VKERVTKGRFIICFWNSIFIEVLSGQKRICLAISDPNTGSDVANLTCVAQLSECGKFYIVNGTKKWITNGMFCDYFVTAVRTGDEGIFGVSMLLIERSEGTILLKRFENQID